MRIAVVSDVHANLAALEAVLEHAGRDGRVEAIWSLGDAVGYGPQPSECLARLRKSDARMIAGNHERAATGAISVDDFNPDAAAAALWTSAQLSAQDKKALDTLPEVIRDAPWTLVHGTLRQPIWEYLYSAEAALGHLQRQETPFGFVGHTHVPMLVLEDGDSPEGCEIFPVFDGQAVVLPEDVKMVLNPGSVGQPRDGDPRASYGLYDTDERTFTLHRVEYAINATQKLMEEAGLPRWLIERLSLGR